ncbi:FAD-binding oxidoreductase [Mycobacterium sp. Dal123C01]|uniref:FAD-binding oxidoreductase n=1 Tax=Mycobacterium sp. Dal123C01 TaxID=3457577 RepID=UPI00403EB369
MLPDLAAEEPAVDVFEAAVRAALEAHKGAAPAVTETTGGYGSAGETAVEINTANLNLTVGADITLAELTHQLREQSVTCPAIAAGGLERTVGELIATATGDERLAVRHGLLGVDVVLPDGHASARFGGQNMKDVAGYDTKRLFIGGHNTFGIITKAIFKIAVAGG